jgi:hypothetical protein
MRSTEASEAARALAAARWTPEARLRAAVATVVTRADELTEVQRAQLHQATEGTDHE